MSREIFDDEALLEGFKNLRDIVKAQKELNHITNKRIALLEKRLENFNSSKPLKLTPDM